VRRRRDDVGERHWIRIDARGHKTGDVRHVDQKHRANIVGDLPEA
jgi:hypothetical protein